MKTFLKNLLLVPMLITGLGLIPAGPARAQTFTVLHSFTAILPFPGPYDNGEGAHPWAGLILSSNTLYGTARTGGSSCFYVVGQAQLQVWRRADWRQRALQLPRHAGQRGRCARLSDQVGGERR